MSPARRRRPAGPIGRLLTALTSALVLAAAAGCAPVSPRPAGPLPSPPAGPTPVTGPSAPTPPPQPAASVDRRDPDAVAVAALTALYSYDTTVDRRPADAARRARPWLSASFRSSITSLPPQSGPGATWSTWAAHRAIVHTTVTPGSDARPDNLATRTYRQYLVTLTPRGRDGWRGPARRITVFLALDRTTTGWAVSTVMPR